jgi:serine protease AprX
METKPEKNGMTGVRANALWGRPGKRVRFYLLAISVLCLAVIGGATRPATAKSDGAYLSAGLLAEATASPDQLFDVIVQAERGRKSDDAVSETAGVLKSDPGTGSKVKQKFFSVAGTSATLTGRQIVKLAGKSKIESITRDAKIELQNYSSTQLWPQAAAIAENWGASLPAGNYPAIAVVDSGVTNLNLGTRLIKSVTFLSASTMSGAYGHGSMVAHIAAGEGAGYAGAEPRAKIVSIKVLDGNGVGVKSDLIAAADWILANKNTHNIRVANFSLNAGGDSIRYDALNKAVEALWLNGIVVVAAAGNYAVNGVKSDVGFAPANDPFVITVGASDTNGTGSRNDDFAAPWSAWGYTQDGFFKPEIAAPGRVMTASVPTGSRLMTLFPDRVVAPNTMWMSGTSFAAPVVSGIAAAILAKNPTWTPDQVKGALMEKATAPSGYASIGALGVGLVNGSAALGANGQANPNAALYQFVSFNTGTGRNEFDAGAWYSTASANASWASASWASASWASASWSSASWANASWSSASWASASWASASWANASWANAFTQP